MRFLVDAQLPRALARQLASAGHDAKHVDDCGLAAASDDLIWRHAEKIGAIIVTKDEHFARRKIMAVGGPQIVWIRLPNTRRRDLLSFFEVILPNLLRALDRDEPLIEVARSS